MVALGGGAGRFVPGGVRGVVVVLVCVLGVCVCLAGVVSSAGAVAGRPGWMITSVAQPTNFPSKITEGCELSSTSCDDYKVIVKNVGGAATSGKVTIIDTPPVGVTAVEVVSDSEPLGLKCSLGPPITCVDEAPLPAGAALGFAVYVTVNPGTSGALTNTATVMGGGAASAATTITQNEVSDREAPFEISDFGVALTDAEAGQDMLAGDHPYALTTDLYFATGSVVTKNKVQYFAPERPKTILVDLPVGLSGDPLAVPRCPESSLAYKAAAVSACPPDSQVGTVGIMAGAGLGGLKGGESGHGEEAGKIGIPLYSLVPERGYPAEFGFIYLGEPVTMYANAVHTASGYRVQVAVPGTIRGFGVYGAVITIWGTPSDPSHNAERERQFEEEGGAEGTGEPTPFLTNPTYCTEAPLTATVAIDSWEHPSRWVSREAVVYPQLTGCGMLQFQSDLTLGPEASTVDTPEGYNSDLVVHQAPNDAQDLATPDVRNVTVLLPTGLAVSPSAADGLLGCQAEGPEGINIGSGEVNLEGADVRDREATQLGEGARDGSPYEDGIYHTAHGHCPAASQVGSVQIVTPVLSSPLEGRVYLAQPECDPCTPKDAEDGQMAGLYIEAEGSGVIIKLKGRVEIGDGGPVAKGLAVGQLRARFEELPQLGPIGEASFHFSGGPRATLANPQTCGTYTTLSDVTPWSSPFTADALPASPFQITGCAGGEMPFAPGFAAGTLTPLGGGYSPLTVTLTRHDGEQDLSGVNVQLPSGLLANLSSVPLCGEPLAAAGKCPAESQIGTATVAAGAGTHPFWISGPVYLTGPYEGAPFGLSIAIPAKAGPFNLGIVVQRTAIHIDPKTAAVTATTTGIPQSLDGVPFRLQEVNVTLDRPNFAFNPTNCEAKTITGTVTGALATEAPGMTVQVSSPFAASGCKNLPFSPSFTASTRGKTSKADGASFNVKVTDTPGQANIAKVKVELPKQLPSRLTTIQKACREATFNANPASCPEGSNIGTATATTPVLPVRLTGPVYLVSHGGAAFPDIVIVLQGDNVTIDLEGSIFISKSGITSSTFASVPDAPISTFELQLPQGPHSALTTNLPAKAKRNLCGQKLTMPTTITAQNGTQNTQNTKITINDCTKTTTHTTKTKKKKRSSDAATRRTPRQISLTFR
jgi:hypothetical protein